MVRLAHNDWYRFVGNFAGYKLPDELVDFWRRYNGFGLNGQTIYAAKSVDDAIDDARTATELYAEGHPDYYLVGQAGSVYLYVWRPSKNRYEFLGLGDPEGEPDESFEAFDEFLCRVLGTAVG